MKPRSRPPPPRAGRALAFAVGCALLHQAHPVAAQPPPSPTASAIVSPPAPAPDIDLRERVARLDEALKARQADIQRLQDDQTKLKERLDGFWTTLWATLGAIVGVLAVAAGFFFPRMRKGIVEEGRHGIVKAILAELLKDEPARLTQLFEAQRDELARLLLAKDRRIALVGEDDQRDAIHSMLEKAGYTNIVDDQRPGDLIVLVGKTACDENAKELLRQARSGDLKPVVLYTGATRIDNAILTDLNEVTLAVTANTPSTVVAHVATLAALTQKLPAKRTKA